MSQLEEEQRRRRAAAFHEWEERMGEAELMESGRAERLGMDLYISNFMVYSQDFQWVLAL